MNFLDLLEHSYKVACGTGECPPADRLDYLSEYIFGFITYDPGISAVFAAKAVDVCAAVTNHTTFGYIKDPDDYTWFLLMCNMPFFVGRLEWGCSIRGAWWNVRPGKEFELNSCGLWDGEDQITTLRFTAAEWENFMRAIIEFASSGAG